MKTPNNSAVSSSLNHQSRFWRLSRLEFWTAGTVSQPWLGAKGRDPAEATDKKILPVEIEKPGWTGNHLCTLAPDDPSQQNWKRFKRCAAQRNRGRDRRSGQNPIFFFFPLLCRRLGVGLCDGRNVMIPLAGFAISRLQPDPGPDPGTTEWTTGLSHRGRSVQTPDRREGGWLSVRHAVILIFFFFVFLCIFFFSQLKQNKTKSWIDLEPSPPPWSLWCWPRAWRPVTITSLRQLRE